MNSPAPFEISGQATPSINRDTNGAPLSVVVRLYQLKEREAFNKLSFDLLASGRSDSELFGSSLTGKSEFVMLPGTKYNAGDKVLPDTKYIGIVALFRKPDANHWRLLVDAKTVREKGLNFLVQDCSLALNGIKPVAIPGQALDAKPNCSVSPSTASAAGTAMDAKPASRVQKKSALKRKKLVPALANSR
jgi:type VI secretion system protein VasD